MISFFSIIRKSYKPSAAVAKNTVLKIIPLVPYNQLDWQNNKVADISQKYHGVIFTQNINEEWLTENHLNQLLSFSKDIKKISPEFKIYLQITPGSTELFGAEYEALKEHSDWFIDKQILDIANPLYRQHFFAFYKQALEKAGVDGLYLSLVDKCPPGVSMSDCSNRFNWWSMSMQDFVAQIRQFYSDKIVLFQSLPLDSQNFEFNNKLLAVFNGMVITDFSTIYNGDMSFKNYFTYLSSLKQSPNFLNKEFVFQVRADESLQPFFMASYLLFASDNSSYYFSSTSSQLSYFEDWDNVYENSLVPSFLRPDGVYERVLNNAVVLVNSNNTPQIVKLNQLILKSAAAKINNDKPVNFLDTLEVRGKSAIIVNIKESSLTPSPTIGLVESADWSDRNSSVYSDFIDVYAKRNFNSVILGEQVSEEKLPRNFDTMNDSLYINGLEGGIFSLKRNEVYDFTINLSNFDSHGYRLGVWVDWDGKGNDRPVSIYKLNSRDLRKVTFKVFVPLIASDNIFLRIIADNDINAKELNYNENILSGEIEDYFLKIN